MTAHMTGRTLGATLALAALPFLLLVGLFALVFTVGLPSADGVPVEDLYVERVAVREGAFEVTLRNVGPEPVSVAQVAVNDMLVAFAPADQAVPRLSATTFRIDFDWVEAEPYEIVFVTTNAIKFSAEVEAAVLTPEADGRTLGTLALLGVYVGVVPVLAGLLWRPVLTQLPPRALAIVLGVTIGLLLFLAGDALIEGFEIADELPAVAGGPFLLVASGLAAFASLELASARLGAERPGARPLVLAALVALGIGLHNFAEGLAIGGAFSLGEVALGAFLVVGFALHNTTEGLAIVAPLGARPTPILAFLGLGLLAGLPTVPGAWIGGLAPSPYLGVLFLGIGAGAILQVAHAIDRSTDGSLRRSAGLAGVAIGVLVMYATSLLVPV